jgi:hypothetical protein
VIGWADDLAAGDIDRADKGHRRGIGFGSYATAYHRVYDVMHSHLARLPLDTNTGSVLCGHLAEVRQPAWPQPHDSVRWGANLTGVTFPILGQPTVHSGTATAYANLCQRLCA